MGLMKRRRFLTAAGLGAGAALLGGLPALAQAAPTGLAMPGYPALGFRAVLPAGLEWTESPEPVTDFEAAGLFTAFDRLWTGRDPGGRDRLEISVYAARIRPERVAIASDYGRILARAWGPDSYEVSTLMQNFGAVLTGDRDRRTRLLIWRRGFDLLILRADTDVANLEPATDRLATMVNSLEFLEAADDPVERDLRTNRLRLPWGGDFAYPMLGQWRLFGEENDSARIAAAIWLDKADDLGDSAVGVFGVAYPEGVTAADAPLRAIATGMSDLMMENLAPDVAFARVQMDELRIPEFGADSRHALYRDRLDWADGRRIGAQGFVLAMAEGVVGISSLRVHPSTMEEAGRSVHGAFVERFLIYAVRAAFGPPAAPD